MRERVSGRYLFAALGLIAVGLLAADSHAIEVVGATKARFSWQPASGPVAAYLVYVSRNGAAFPQWPEQYSLEPRTEVAGSVGQTIIVAVSALSANGMAGPLSEPSHPVRFVTTPSPASIGVSPTIIFASATPDFEPPVATISVVNTGGGSLEFQVATFTPWVRATPSSGSSVLSEVPLRLDFDTVGLAPGIHFSAVTIRAAGVPDPVVIPVILTVLEPIPSFELSAPQVRVRAILGQPPQEVLLGIAGSVPGSSYSIETFTDWIHPGSESGTIGEGQTTLSLEIDPTGLPRGTYSGYLYLVPSDPRARILAADVTMTVVDPSAPRRMGPDLDGDGRADLIWRDRTTGDVQLWLMNGALRLGSIRLAGPSPAADWALVALGDLDGDGRADLVWQRASTGQALAWFMNGLVKLRTETLPTPDAGWQVVAADDVDGDQRADLVLHQPDTGEVSVWLMRGGTRTGTLEPERFGEPVATVVGCGDFDTDGRADVVWHTTSGGTRLWLSRGEGLGEVVPLNAAPEAGWDIAGIADQDGDGKSDLVWRNALLRETLLWRFESPALIDVGSLPSMRYPGWKLVAAADFDGDGASDLLWRNTSTGQTTMWRMEGFLRRQGLSVLSPPPLSWEIQP